MMTRREGGCSLEQKEADMLGPDGIPGSSDVLDELRHVLDDKGGDGDNGGKGGGGNGSGGDSGGDPYDRPATVRELLDACKQVAGLVANMAELSAEKTAAFAETMAERSSALVMRDMLEMFKAENEARARLVDVLIKRFEAIEHNVGMICKHLGARYEGDEKRDAEDEGSGP
jgi:hypothetical protein